MVFIFHSVRFSSCSFLLFFPSFHYFSSPLLFSFLLYLSAYFFGTGISVQKLKHKLGTKAVPTAELELNQVETSLFFHHLFVSFFFLLHHHTSPLLLRLLYSPSSDQRSTSRTSSPRSASDLIDSEHHSPSQRNQCCGVHASRHRNRTRLRTQV